MAWCTFDLLNSLLRNRNTCHHYKCLPSVGLIFSFACLLSLIGKPYLRLQRTAVLEQSQGFISKDTAPSAKARFHSSRWFWSRGSGKLRCLICYHHHLLWIEMKTYIHSLNPAFTHLYNLPVKDKPMVHTWHCYQPGFLASLINKNWSEARKEIQASLYWGACCLRGSKNKWQVPLLTGSLGRERGLG